VAINPNDLSSTATPTFDDEFSSLDLWNGSSGIWDTSYPWAPPGGGTNPTNRELEWYINASYSSTNNVDPWYVTRGILHITAAPAALSIKPYIDYYDYTSGILTTYHSFAQTYGYFEMRARLPEGKGLWPAFWLLPVNQSWPPELDVMEVLGSSPQTVYTTVHSGSDGRIYSIERAAREPDTSSGYHTYGVDWEAKTITWYFDGRMVFRTLTPSDMHQPMYMLVDLAVGGAWPGSPNSSTKFPADMKIDYIRAYHATRINAQTSADRFVFDNTPKGGVDRITHFNVATDRLVLSQADFPGLGEAGYPLAATHFYIGRHAAGLAQHIIYNPQTGFLYYDSDGSGVNFHIHFATMSPYLALVHTDFLVAA
jgi:beta-glucanase (GH16 family)